MKELIVGSTKQKALIDDEDYERLVKFTWSFSGTGIQREKAGIKRLRISLAQEVMRRMDVMFDHADRNPLNNQKYNLRECTFSQNNHNRTKRKGTASKYKGVVWHKKANKWQAQIRINGVNIYLGCFVMEEDAAKAYDKAAIKLFKEFANLNFIESEPSLL